MRRSRIAGLLLAAACLGGCFHLRGSATESDLGAVQLTAVHTFESTPFVERALARSGVRLVDEGGSAAVVIQLLEEKLTRQTVSYTGQARTAEYEVTLTLVFRASRTNGDELVADRQLRASRVFLLDRDNLQGSSRQEDLLRDEMTADLAEQIVRAVDAANRNVPKTAKVAGS